MSNTTPTQKVRSDGHVQTYHEGKSKPATKAGKGRKLPSKPPATPTTGNTGIAIPQLKDITFSDRRVPDCKHVLSAKYKRNGSGSEAGHMVSIVDTSEGRMLITDFAPDANTKRPEGTKYAPYFSVMNLDDLAQGDISRSWRGDDYTEHRNAIYRRYLEEYYQEMIDSDWVPGLDPNASEEERDEALVRQRGRYASMFVNDIENAFVNDEAAALSNDW